MPLLAIKDYIFGGVVLALLAALAFVTISKTHEISKLQLSIDDPKTGWSARLQASQLDYATCKSNRLVQQAAIDDQNTALQRIGVETEAQRRAVAAALAANARTMASADAKIASARAAKPATANQCAEANALIMGSIK